MRIRKAEAGDAAVIADIQVRAWRVAYQGLMPPETLAGLKVETGVELWTRLLTKPHRTLVAEGVEGSVAGYCSVVPDRQGGDGVAEIAALYVSPEQWRQGCGRRLCGTALAAAVADGFTAMALWVLRGNVRAISFYEQMGFSPDGTTQVERLGDGTEVAEIRMRRRLG